MGFVDEYFNKVLYFRPDDLMTWDDANDFFPNAFEWILSFSITRTPPFILLILNYTRALLVIFITYFQLKWLQTYPLTKINYLN